jgi:hypothetical protein
MIEDFIEMGLKLSEEVGRIREDSENGCGLSV